MKKIIFFVFVLSILASVGFGQYYDNNNERNDYYYDTDYEEDNLTYEYGYEEALPYLQNYNGRVYYWVHPHENLYFVIIGRKVFIIPGYHINRIRNSMRWFLVTMDRFIALTCFGLPYYDNYVRFHYYNDYYNRHRYNSYNNHMIRDNYRMYYKNRRGNKHYYRYQDRVPKKREQISNERYHNNGYYNRYKSTNKRSGPQTYRRPEHNRYQSDNRYRNHVKERSVYNKPTPKSSFQYSRENTYKRSISTFKNHNFKSPRFNYQNNNPKRSRSYQRNGSYHRENSYKKSQSGYGKQSSYPQKKRNVRYKNRRN